MSKEATAERAGRAHRRGAGVTAVAGRRSLAAAGARPGAAAAGLRHRGRGGHGPLRQPRARATGGGLTLAPGERALVPTGLALAIPAGFEVQVRPRSGLALRHGLTLLNTPGHHRQRLSRRGRGDPGQPRGRAVRDRARHARSPRWCWRRWRGSPGARRRRSTASARGAGGFGSTGTGGDGRGEPRPRSSSATPATSCCTRSAGRGSSGCARRGCWWSAPAGSAARRCSISPPRGSGTLGVVDDDAVSLSNLQRQVLHATAEIGAPKVASAARALARLNPHVAVEAARAAARRRQRRRAGRRATTWCSTAATTSPTRYLVNAACVARGPAAGLGGDEPVGGADRAVPPGGRRALLRVRLPRAAGARGWCRAAPRRASSGRCPG